MGADAPRGLTVDRSRARAYLLLARFSNLPTVWTNVVAGTVASGAAFTAPLAAWLCAAISFLYTAGMFLNDAFDREFDARARPDRPIPAGNVTVRETFAAGWTLLGVGLFLLAWKTNAAATLWGLALSAAIVYYDYRHKQNPFGPVVMGLCRGLVYCVAAAASSGVTLAVAIAALLLTGYVISLTWVAKSAGASAGWLVPILIAGISIVDGIVIGFNGGGALLWLGVVGFVATLLLQRVVPGT